MSEAADSAQLRRECCALKEQRDELLEACKAQHEALDIALAMVITLTRDSRKVTK